MKTLQPKYIGPFAYFIFDGITHPKFEFKKVADVVNLLKENDIKPSDIHHLIIPNNSIEIIDETIAEFTSLKELNLINNSITSHGENIFEFFEQRMNSVSSQYNISVGLKSKRVSFILLLGGNPICHYDFESSCFTRDVGTKCSRLYDFLWSVDSKIKKRFIRKNLFLKRRVEIFTDLCMVEDGQYRLYYLTSDEVRSTVTGKLVSYLVDNREPLYIQVMKTPKLSKLLGLRKVNKTKIPPSQTNI